MADIKREAMAVIQSDNGIIEDRGDVEFGRRSPEMKLSGDGDKISQVPEFHVPD